MHDFEEIEAEEVSHLQHSSLSPSAPSTPPLQFTLLAPLSPDVLPIPSPQPVSHHEETHVTQSSSCMTASTSSYRSSSVLGN